MMSDWWLEEDRWAVSGLSASCKRPDYWCREPQGLKPQNFGRSSARLKPCPDVTR